MTEDGGGPLPGADDQTIRSHLEAVEGTYSLQIGGEMRSPDLRWGPSSQWPIRDIALQTNEVENTEEEKPEEPPQ
ncbi:MAG: hypothetical protein V5A58_11500 [Salinibacter sp.]|uniref:hypothetical protein n=1 Tax=Salinibacter sp. TaxID=2065818 RepID=UPI002FC3858D